MRLNKYFSALLGGAALLGLSACTDEVEYTPAAVPAGDEVFFSNEIPSTIDIEQGATVVELPVQRLRASGELYSRPHRLGYLPGRHRCFGSISDSF